MKQVILAAIVTILLSGIGSCARGRMGWTPDNSSTRAEERFEQALNSITQQNSEALKAMFSAKALSEQGDIDKQIEYVFGVLRGTVESWEETGFSSGESIRNGKQSIMLRSWYTVVTDEDCYAVFMLDYSKDTMNPDNEGLYSLWLVRQDDEEKVFTTWQEMNIAGIYMPEEESLGGIQE